MKVAQSVLVFAVIFAGSAAAKDVKKGHLTPLPAKTGKVQPPPAKPAPTVIAHSSTAKISVQPSPAPAREPLVKATVTFSSNERQIIHSYVQSCTAAEKPGKKPKGLPPGLAKKVARGGELPPGWQKKCVRGQIMPAEVYKHCHPLPHEIIVKLPPPPPGTILVAIDGKIARLARASLEILDVFDVL